MFFKKKESRKAIIEVLLDKKLKEIEESGIVTGEDVKELSNYREAIIKLNAGKSEKFDKAIKVIEVLAPLMLTVWGTVVTFRFEKTGTITTQMGRNFINRLMPKK